MAGLVELRARELSNLLTNARRGIPGATVEAVVAVAAWFADALDPVPTFVFCFFASAAVAFASTPANCLIVPRVSCCLIVAETEDVEVTLKLDCLLIGAKDGPTLFLPNRVLLVAVTGVSTADCVDAILAEENVFDSVGVD
jgi:hypothetical protein